MKKIVSFIFALVLVFALSISAYAADVGYVNRQKIMQNYPGIEDVLKDLQASGEEAQKEFAERTKNANDAEKAKVNNELAMRVIKKEQEVMGPILQKIEEAIDKVAKSKKCSFVIDEAAVIAGGTDLTDFVIKEVNKKK